MGETLQLEAADGHKFSAYKAMPSGAPKGAVVIVQEIFGVNEHIRDVCDGYAKEGFVAIAPALFDRIGPDLTLGYESDDIQQGIKYKMQIADNDALADIDAAAEAVVGNGSIAVIGYCWGGSLAYLSACRLASVDKAVGYYGGQIAKDIDEEPKIPIILHFGDSDGSIPMEDIEKVKAARPDIPVYIYHAGHGFNCDMRGSYDAGSAKLALQRTLEFIA